MALAHPGSAIVGLAVWLALAGCLENRPELIDAPPGTEQPAFGTLLDPL